MKKFDESEGVWRTIAGRRVFIRKGQSLASAMKESGKFKVKSRNNDNRNNDEENNKNKVKVYDNRGVNLDAKVDSKYVDWAIAHASDSKDKEFWLNIKAQDTEKEPSYYIDRKDNKKMNRENNNIKEQDKFYTRKDGTKEYDPYKGTKFEKKYDSVEEALNDPNHPTRKYIDEKLKVPKASGAKDFSEYGIRIEDENVKSRFSDYLRDKYGTDDFRIISYDDNKKAQNIYSEFNKQELKAYQDKMLNNDEYLAKNNPGMYLTKIEKENNVRTFADDITLKERYSGTIKYLQQTTNMNIAQIIELLKKIDEDKK